MIINKEDARIIRGMLGIYRAESKRKPEILIAELIANKVVAYSVYGGI